MEFDQDTLLIDRRILKAAAHFVSAEPNATPYMQRIFIDTYTLAPQVFVVASNGSALAIFNCGVTESCVPPALVSPAAVNVIPVLKKDSQLQDVGIYNGALCYTDGDGNETRSKLFLRQESGAGGIYFNWRRLIPEAPSGRQGHFATSQWEPFKKARKSLGLADQHPLHVGHNGNQLAIVTWPDYADFLGLMKPLSSEDVTLPDWIAPERLLIGTEAEVS